MSKVLLNEEMDKLKSIRAQYKQLTDEDNGSVNYTNCGQWQGYCRRYKCSSHFYHLQRELRLSQKVTSKLYLSQKSLHMGFI